MVARFHYDDLMLLRLVRDQLPAEQEQEVTAHVEECPTCQSKMESVAEAGISWNDVRRFLDPGSLDEGHVSGCQFASETSPLPSDRKPSDEERRVDFLASSDTSQSLGRFGRYEITEILGRGGMGIVMRGYDPALDRHSAIKVLAPELATSAAARRRFSREAKSAAAVVHDHVIPIHTVDEVRGLPYLVMPVVEGKSLEQRVADEGPLPVVEVLRIGMQIASGLAAAHAQGLVHRDIKPANILLENGVERVMVTDFGLARAADDANMTRSGVLAGTPQYMSPEQARGEDVDHRSDLFSLGSVLYFICTGHPPFRAQTMMGVLSRIANDKPRSLRKINADVPAWLQAIVDRLLDKDREQRYQSASEVADLLGQWLAHLQQPDAAPRPPEPVTPLASTGSGHPRNGRLIGLAAAGGAILLAAIVVILQGNKGTIKIDCPHPGVGVRIMKGDRLSNVLTVTPGNDSVRVAVGEYVVEIDGEHDGLTVQDGEVTVTRGETHLVSIVQEDVAGTDDQESDRRISAISDVPMSRGSRDAALHYWRAFSLLPTLDAEKKTAISSALKQATVDDELRQLVQSSHSALRELRKGAMIEECCWGISPEDGEDLVMPHLDRALEIGRIASLRAKLRFEQDQIEDAIEDLDSVVTLAKHVAVDNLVISLLVSYLIERTAIETFAAGLPAMDADQLDAVAERIDTLSPRISMSEAVLGEKELLVAWINRINSDSDEKQTPAAAFRCLDSETARAFRELSRTELIRTANDMQAFYDRMAEAMALSPDDARRAEEQLKANPGVDDPGRAMALAMIPVIHGARIDEVTRETYVALLKAAIAVQKDGPIVLRRGAYRDPFGGRAFRYVELADGFRLESGLIGRSEQPVSLTVGGSASAESQGPSKPAAGPTESGVEMHGPADPDGDLKPDPTVDLRFHTLPDSQRAVLKFRADPNSAPTATTRHTENRVQSADQLKALGIAFHNYHAMHDRFPPAVIMGPDGETPHSWRVELLPYLDERELFDRYRMNEPWDSPHNKKLVQEMPDVFRHPAADQESTNSSYFALTGEGAVLDDEQGRRLEDIEGGPSNAILLVEAKREIPWTKPEDIPLMRTSDEIPVLHCNVGGFGDGTCHVLLCDGSVRAVSQTVHADVADPQDASDDLKKTSLYQDARVAERMKNGDTSTRQEILRQLFAEPKKILTLDDSFLDAFMASADDADEGIRHTSLALIGERWIWKGGEQEPRAIKFLLDWSHDEDAKARYNCVYYGLSTLRPMDEATVDRLIELAVERDQREKHSVLDRVLWGFRANKDLATSRIQAFLDRCSGKESGKEQEAAARAVFLYLQLTERLPTGLERFSGKGTFKIIFAVIPSSRSDAAKKLDDRLASLAKDMGGLLDVKTTSRDGVRVVVVTVDSIPFYSALLLAFHKNEGVQVVAHGLANEHLEDLQRRVFDQSNETSSEDRRHRNK